MNLINEQFDEALKIAADQIYKVSMKGTRYLTVKELTEKMPKEFTIDTPENVNTEEKIIGTCKIVVENWKK